ncbi:hypothetical protein [Oceanospirillum sp.]|uniref:hypothetical protein n=1 Tax=Oceanospirillum sp. TaxID=2021254 RepID=UPI003A95B13D
MAKNQLRILADNLHDTAVLTATSEALPIANTQRSERPMVWRSADLQTQVIEATLPTGGWVDCIALARHNLGGAGVLKIEFFNAGTQVGETITAPTALLIPAGLWRAGIDGWGASYNDEMPAGSPLGIHWLDTPVVIDSYRITLEGGGPDSYIEIGRIFVGLSFSPAVNFNWGLQVQWQENAEHIPTEGGSLRTVGGGDLRRSFALQLDWLNDADRVQLVTQLVRVGLGADLLVALYPKGNDLLQLEHTMVCRRESSFSHTHNHFQNWQASLQFIEV